MYMYMYITIYSHIHYNIVKQRSSKSFRTFIFLKTSNKDS